MTTPETAQKEREAIVAFIRNKAKNHHDTSCDNMFSLIWRHNHAERCDALILLARWIEIGDHNAGPDAMHIKPATYGNNHD